MINDIKARQIAYKVALDNVDKDREAYHRARTERDFYAYDDIEYLLNKVEQQQETLNLALTALKIITPPPDIEDSLPPELEIISDAIYEIELVLEEK